MFSFKRKLIIAILTHVLNKKLQVWMESSYYTCFPKGLSIRQRYKLTITTFFYLLYFIVLLINFGNPYSSNTWTGAILFNGYEVITRDGKNWTRTLFSLPIRVYPCPFYRPTSSVFIVRARRSKAGAALSFFLSFYISYTVLILIRSHTGQPTPGILRVIIIRVYPPFVRPL